MYIYYAHEGRCVMAAKLIMYSRLRGTEQLTGKFNGLKYRAFARCGNLQIDALTFYMHKACILSLHVRIIACSTQNQLALIQWTISFTIVRR